MLLVTTKINEKLEKLKNYNGVLNSSFRTLQNLLWTKIKEVYCLEGKKINNI
jgi:hypothetical protein